MNYPKTLVGTLTAHPDDGGLPLYFEVDEDSSFIKIIDDNARGVPLNMRVVVSFKDEGLIAEEDDTFYNWRPVK